MYSKYGKNKSQYTIMENTQREKVKTPTHTKLKREKDTQSSKQRYITSNRIPCFASIDIL